MFWDEYVKMLSEELCLVDNLGLECLINTKSRLSVTLKLKSTIMIYFIIFIISYHHLVLLYAIYYY